MKRKRRHGGKSGPCEIVRCEGDAFVFLRLREGRGGVFFFGGISLHRGFSALLIRLRQWAE